MLTPLLRLLVSPKIIDHNRQLPISGKPLYLIERNLWSHRRLIKILMDSGHPPGAQGRSWRLTTKNSSRLEHKLSTIIHAQRNNPALDYQLIPVGIYHGRMPKKEHNWFRLLFSESWSEHSLFNRTMQLLFNGRKTLVRINPAIALQATIEQQPDTDHCCQKIHQQLQQQFNSARRSKLLRHHN